MVHDERLSVITLRALAFSHEEIDGMANPVLQHLGCPGRGLLPPTACTSQ
jgi:hypothetical protein